MQIAGSYMPINANKKLYNAGSEWQDDIDGLSDYYSTFFREYDPVIGTFNGVDPLAVMANEISTYAYADDNPIMFNDPLGDYVKHPRPPDWREWGYLLKYDMRREYNLWHMANYSGSGRGWGELNSTGGESGGGGGITRPRGGVRGGAEGFGTNPTSWLYNKNKREIKFPEESSVDDGLLSCKSFIFTEVSKSTNYYETGVSNLNFVLDLAVDRHPFAPTLPIGRVFKFRTIFIGIPIVLSNGTKISTGKAAALSAQAANAAGTFLQAKYYGISPEQAASLTTAVVETEFKNAFSASLSLLVGGLTNVYFNQIGKNTIISKAIYNNWGTRILNRIFGVGCGHDE